MRPVAECRDGGCLRVFLVVQVQADGKMVAPRIQVIKDGVKPPQEPPHGGR